MNVKKIIIFIIGFVSSIAVFAEKPAFNIQHWTLKNNAHVFFVRRTEVPMLDIAVIFSAGSSMDKNSDGIAALTNEMLDEGANDLTAERIANQFESVGAQFSTFVNRDMAGLQLRTLTNKQYLDSAIATFSAIIQSPNFPENELIRDKHQLLAQLQSQEQNPADIASNTFFQLLYQQNPYAHNPLGNTASIQQITQNQLIHFYKEYYVGANANVILVGDISEEQAKQIAETIVGKLPTGKPAPTLMTANDSDQSIVKNIDYPSTQTTVMMGQVGITRENPDYFSLMVGNVILGGAQTSLLYNEVREKNGLAYFASSGFDALKYRGPFIMMLQTKNESAQQSLNLTKNVFTDFLKNGPTDSQLSIAKQNLINNLSLGIASNRGILRVLINIVFYHRPLNYLDTFAAHVNAVTALAVRNAFQKNLKADKFVTIVVGKDK